MVLGDGGGSKPSVSFLNFEPTVSKFPPDQNIHCSGLFTTTTIIVFGDYGALFLYLYLIALLPISVR
ncbi:hypothetical protein SPAP_0101 [Streptococcus pneumoniae AP200]|nr:hypothetical protein SPAP_0101 [Streptococcus pneumoniae AP200]